MLAFLSEFGMLFAIFAGLLLTVAWRKGWFSEHLADEISVNPEAGEPASRAFVGRPGKPGGAMPESAASGRPVSPPNGDVRVVKRDGQGGFDEATGEDRPAARQLDDAIRAAQALAATTYPTFWSKEAIQQRAGWMLFEPSDFLGEPDVLFDYPIPGSDHLVRVPLYSAGRLRALEQENTLIEMSRRKVIQARWNRRCAARQPTSASPMFSKKQ